MSSPKTAPGNQPDWTPIMEVPAGKQSAMSQLKADYSAILRKMPKTADEALDLAHQEYIAAETATKTATRYFFRFRKQRRLLDVAGLSYSSATWLMLEEQRLRIVELQANDSTDRLQATDPGVPCSGRD
ncbi:hypothetical protein [Amycolatopsis sp. NPDC059657]|uniref:hypothetical protein n=1 Tax=Amycolatopsis sp. NPDC059657 TaxID=3346899 RepID=UPI00366D3425